MGWGLYQAAVYEDWRVEREKRKGNENEKSEINSF